MRLIVQGIGLALAALIAFCASGWLFLYEQALHDQGAVVSARITDLRADYHAARNVSQMLRGRGSMMLTHQTMTFAYTMPDGRTFVTPHRVLLGYTLTHNVGDAVTLRVDPTQPRQFEVLEKDFAGKGFVAGAAGMILAVAAAVSFWLAYEALLERAQTAAQMPHPKARLRRVYMRRP